MVLLYGGLKRSKEKGPASRFLGMKEDELTAPIKAQWVDGQSHHSIAACLLLRFANHLTSGSRFNHVQGKIKTKI